MCVLVNMEFNSDSEDISWLTQSDANQPSFEISDQFMQSIEPVVSLEENVPGRVEIYDSVFAEQISEDKAVDNL